MNWARRTNRKQNPPPYKLLLVETVDFKFYVVRRDTSDNYVDQEGRPSQVQDQDIIAWMQLHMS
jgi:hypothetical protein